MHRPSFPIVLILTAVSLSVQAAPEFLPLDADKMRAMELESIPPFPAEIVLEGESQNWESVLHQGDFVVSVYEAAPAVIDVSDPFPYDEFVLVLEGEVTLTNVDGRTATYKVGDTFLVPKGWLGTWDMPVKYREMIVIETDALLAGEI
ncbi:MAG: cupin domain-containing protein [Gammaproteobacteria bacterium]|nr:cupin domain-containing protein [Gammaproteobacteria bacterium]